MGDSSTVKSDFSYTMCDNPSATECENYGMTWGCDTNCPVLIRGECDLKDSENKPLWDKVRGMGKCDSCGETKKVELLCMSPDGNDSGAFICEVCYYAFSTLDDSEPCTGEVCDEPCTGEVCDE